MWFCSKIERRRKCDAIKFVISRRRPHSRILLIYVHVARHTNETNPTWNREKEQNWNRKMRFPSGRASVTIDDVSTEGQPDCHLQISNGKRKHSDGVCVWMWKTRTNKHRNDIFSQRLCNTIGKDQSVSLFPQLPLSFLFTTAHCAHILRRNVSVSSVLNIRQSTHDDLRMVRFALVKMEGLVAVTAKRPRDVEHNLASFGFRETIFVHSKFINKRFSSNNTRAAHLPLSISIYFYRLRVKKGNEKMKTANELTHSQNIKTEYEKVEKKKWKIQNAKFFIFHF